MERATKINIESIENFGNQLEKSSQDLMGIITYLTNMSDSLLDVFDSNTAKKMQESLAETLLKAKVPCNKLEELSRKVKIFNKSYRELYETTRKSVGG